MLSVAVFSIVMQLFLHTQSSRYGCSAKTDFCSCNHSEVRKLKTFLKN